MMTVVNLLNEENFKKEDPVGEQEGRQRKDGFSEQEKMKPL